MAKHRKPSTATVAVRRVLLGAAAGSLALTGLVSGTASAHASTCTTDLDCAAYELQTALYAGADVAEDLSFDGGGFVTYEDGSIGYGYDMSPLYSAKNDLLADAFWAEHAGEDWDEAKWDLARWLDAYRSA